MVTKVQLVTKVVKVIKVHKVDRGWKVLLVLGVIPPQAMVETKVLLVVKEILVLMD